MSLPKCPGDLAARADALWNNAFGFQGPGASGDYFVIAMPLRYVHTDVLERVKQKTGTSTLREDDWLGNTFLKIHWTEYPFIDTVLTTLLEEGISFSTFTKGVKPVFKPEDKVFSRELLEEKVINEFNKALNMFSEDTQEVYKRCGYNNICIAHEWCWRTDKGKQFCRDLRKKLGKNEICTNSKYDYTKWPRFQNYDPVTLMSIEPPTQPDPEEDIECMICFTNRPDTMVLPCEHVVVCKECSDQLKHTNDARICVRCRRHITHVLD